jgi:hypothetical protein
MSLQSRPSFSSASLVKQKEFYRKGLDANNGAVKRAIRKEAIKRGKINSDRYLEVVKHAAERKEVFDEEALVLKIEEDRLEAIRLVKKVDLAKEVERLKVLKEEAVIVQEIEARKQSAQTEANRVKMEKDIFVSSQIHLHWRQELKPNWDIVKMSKWEAREPPLLTLHSYGPTYVLKAL